MATKNNDTKIFGLSTGELVVVGGVTVGGYFIVKSIYDKIKNTLGGLSDANANAGINNSWWKPDYWKKSNVSLVFTATTTQQLLNVLRNYQGVFNDNYNSVIGVFKTCKTKSQVSWLVDQFYQKYKLDLYTFLKEGHRPLFPWFGDGLSNDHLTEINTYISKLPNYKA